MTDAPPIGVLVMAYGTAAGPDDIERYYTDIRGGRAPSPEHLQELRDRYEAIGNVFPLGETTAAQAEGIVERLNADDDGSSYRAYLGMKHSPPFIPDTVAAMRADGIERGAVDGDTADDGVRRGVNPLRGGCRVGARASSENESEYGNDGRDEGGSHAMDVSTTRRTARLAGSTGMRPRREEHREAMPLARAW